MDSAEQIPTSQISTKKRVGSLKGDPVIAISLKGGLNILVAVHGSKTEILSFGSHRGIARHIAKKNHPELELTELSKSDFIAEEHMSFLLPKYIELTRIFRISNGDEAE